MIYDGRGARRGDGAKWFAFGLVVGLGLGLGAPRLLRRFERPHTEKPARAGLPVAVGNGQVLLVTAKPQRHGLVLSAACPVKLLRPSENKQSLQEGAAVFTGFRNWAATANYLQQGQSGLVLKDAMGAPVDTGWQAQDCAGLVSGQSLQAELTPGQPYTLFFQRRGQRAIDLGTIALTAPPAPKAAAAGHASHKPKA